jgi:hypothetical protein
VNGGQGADALGDGIEDALGGGGADAGGPGGARARSRPGGCSWPGGRPRAEARGSVPDRPPRPEHSDRRPRPSPACRRRDPCRPLPETQDQASESHRPSTYAPSTSIGPGADATSAIRPPIRGTSGRAPTGKTLCRTSGSPGCFAEERGGVMRHAEAVRPSPLPTICTLVVVHDAASPRRSFWLAQTIVSPTCRPDFLPRSTRATLGWAALQRSWAPAKARSLGMQCPGKS